MMADVKNLSRLWRNGQKEDFCGGRGVGDRMDAKIEVARNEKGAGGIHSRPIFQALLKHERARADRVGGCFSLAIFDVSSLRGDGQQIERIAGQIRRKVRSIDEAGWLEGSRIGVILPATDREGGRTFVRRVLESTTLSIEVPSTICTYPTSADGGVDVDAGRDESHPQAIFSQHYRQDIPVWKRATDVAVSLVALVLLSPFFLVLILYIKCVSPGRAFFTQKRVGVQGRLFTFWKFRTMQESTDQSSHRDYVKELIRARIPMEKLDCGGDRRIIPGGKIIRKACLDELPQLINVLKGEMSLVGPRPCIPYEAAEYLRWHAHRFDILPGMTGLWQVSGKNKLSFEEMVRLDISYADRLSFGLDIKILLRTVPTIVGLVFEAAARKSTHISPPSAEEVEWDMDSTCAVGSGAKGSVNNA